MPNIEHAPTARNFLPVPDRADQDRDFLLASLRVGRTRVQLVLLELDEIGLCLKHNLIGFDEAVARIVEIGAGHLIPIADVAVDA